ncbi:MAG: hypothetical protein ACPGRW_06060 [Flavobacteriaceae bacterium]
MKQEEYIKKLVEFKPSMKTAEVVKYLDSKKYHADDLRSPENKKRLGAKRKGKRNLIYDTFKVLQLKIELLKSA